jgi:hypothetical protein
MVEKHGGAELFNSWKPGNRRNSSRKGPRQDIVLPDIPQ